MHRLNFDPAGRITLPEKLCEEFGFVDWVVVVGLKDRFQIWDREAYRARREAEKDAARTGLIRLREQQRAAKLGSGA